MTGDAISCTQPTTVPFRSAGELPIWLNPSQPSLVQDPLTGKIEQIFKTPYKKAHHIGGTLPVCVRLGFQNISIFHLKGFGLKLFSCYELSTCTDWSQSSWDVAYEPLQHYMLVYKLQSNTANHTDWFLAEMRQPRKNFAKFLGRNLWKWASLLIRNLHQECRNPVWKVVIQVFIFVRNNQRQNLQGRFTEK